MTGKPSIERPPTKRPVLLSNYRVADHCLTIRKRQSVSRGFLQQASALFGQLIFTITNFRLIEAEERDWKRAAQRHRGW
jgi:hypothetical protein